MALTDETIGTLVEAIDKVYESSLTESVLKRLDSFGYTPTENDAFVVAFSVRKVEISINNDCNVSEVPEGLMNIAVDMVCGEVLSVKYRTGQLELSSLDLDGAIASVNVGGASVSFDKESHQICYRFPLRLPSQLPHSLFLLLEQRQYFLFLLLG